MTTDDDMSAKGRPERELRPLGGLRASSSASVGAVDWLDDLLSEDAAATRDDYIADDGFTARVMSALPAPMALPKWRKPAVAVLWAVAAAGFAVAAPGAVVDVAREAYRLLATVPVSITGIATAMAAIVAATGAAAAYTLGRND